MENGHGPAFFSLLLVSLRSLCLCGSMFFTWDGILKREGRDAAADATTESARNRGTGG